MTEIGKHTKDLTGLRFGHLLVESFAGVNHKRAAEWHCLCDCGTRVIIRGDTLQKRSQSCGGPTCRLSKHHKYPEPGDKFGMLTAIGYSHANGKGGGLYWKFKCDCGNEDAKIRWFQVKTKAINHCGCQRSIKFVETEYGVIGRYNFPVARMWHQSKSRAKTISVEFSLTKEQVKILVTGNCFFCGTEPCTAISVSKRKILSKETSLKYNGIDRWDSSAGYTANNCVSCCKTCNYAKREMSAEEFIKWLVRATSHATDLINNWKERKKAVEELLLRP